MHNKENEYVADDGRRLYLRLFGGRGLAGDRKSMAAARAADARTARGAAAGNHTVSMSYSVIIDCMRLRSRKVGNMTRTG